MPSLAEFLNHVLQGDGYKCWVALKKGERPQQGFSSSTEDLAATLTGLDALGYDAYFACSMYKEPVNRKAENVRFASSFWMDIDYGTDGHGQPCAYPDEDAACDAIENFCDQVGMPHPTIVYSGGGIHAYWPLSRPLTPDEWIPNAKLLKQLAASKGLHADPTRTADIASILRPPTTRNWKLPGQPRTVECLEIVDGTIQLPDATQPQPAIAASPVQHAAQTLYLNSAATAIYSTEREPSYASVAANQCAQLRSFRNTRGNISEPVWYAALGVLAQCADGEQLAHEWSSGHPSYTAEETSRKLIQARNAAGATTCEHFKSVNPAGCAGCPFAVTSPIVLGRVKKEFAAAAVQAVETFPPMPAGYSINQNYQLTVEVKHKDSAGIEKKYNRPFTHYPIFLVEVRDSEHAERKQGMLFRQWEPVKGWVEFEVAGKALASMGSWGELADYGALMLDSDNRKHFLKYVDATVAMRKGEAKKMRYEQFGWKMDYAAFYLGNTLFKNDGTTETAAGNAECTNRGKKLSVAKNGSQAAWTAAANKLFIEGCEAQSFGLLTSFASPLMSLITQPGEGGAIFSLISPDGGSGKTTTMIAIASVWGELEAIRLSGNDTQNAKYRGLGTICHLPVIHDELRSRHPELIVEFVRSFTEGRDKHRARIDGTVNPVVHAWCNILSSASNLSLVDCINGVQKSGEDAMSNRVFEVEAKKPKDANFSLTGELGNELILNRGHAGRAYLAYLLQPGMIDWCRANLNTMVEHYTKVTGAQTCHRYLIRLAATVAIAAEICVHLGLMEFSPKRIMEWAIAQIIDVVAGTTKFDPVTTLNEILHETIISDALIVNCAATPKADVLAYQTPRSEVNMRFEVDTQKLYISSNWIRQKFNDKGQPFSLVVKELETQKILLDRKRRTVLTGGLKHMPGGQVVCWDVDMSHGLMSQIFIKEVLPFKIKAV